MKETDQMNMNVYAIRTVDGVYYCKSDPKNPADFYLTDKHPKLFTSKRAVKRWIEQRIELLRGYANCGPNQSLDEVFEVIKLDGDFTVYNFSDYIQRPFFDAQGVRLQKGQKIAIAQENHQIVGTIDSFGKDTINYTVPSGSTYSVTTALDNVIVIP